MVGDMVVAAHLDDLLFVERARFHRARREAGRAIATGDKEEVAIAQDRLREAASGLGAIGCSETWRPGGTAGPQ